MIRTLSTRHAAMTMALAARLLAARIRVNRNQLRCPEDVRKCECGAM